MGTEMGRSRARTGTQIPSVAASLPEDGRNTARETRARYRYQDECAALALLNHLDSEDLDGVLIEHSTDLILLPANGVPELVSIKHREPNQSGEPGWSWNALKRQRVLIDLYHAWNSADRSCTLAFWTNASFNGSTHRLWQVCARQAEPTQDLLRSLTAQLGASRADAEAFLPALRIPEDPLPRRKEITDVGVRRTTELLQKHRPGSPLHAEECYRALVNRIAKAGTDVPEAEARPKPTVAATLAAAADRSQVRFMRRFLPARQLLDELLSVHDRLEAGSLPDAGQHGWEPDAQFIGRSDFLNKLDKLLQPGMPLEVAPVVIHGIPGCGKTSLAAQFAATHKAIFRPIFISASSRAALISELTALAGYDNRSNWDGGIAQLRGPVTPRLPGNSATLLIIDGVTDADSVRGIVPRKSLCRIIITSTVSYLEQGYEHLELNGWSRAESHKFISTILSETSPEDREELARALYDHPLALTQAVNYCRLTGHNIPGYLTRLAREPLIVLDRGQASGHSDSVLKAIKINIDAANERFPRCTEILYLFSHLGSSPIDESILDHEGLILALVVDREIQIASAERGWWPVRKRRRAGSVTPAYGFTQRGSELFQSLCEHAWRDQAIEVLLLMSLISRRDKGLVVHPLVALVARKLAGNPRPWVEVGLGLFVPYIEEGRTKDFITVDPYIDNLAALGSTALDAGLSGPTVLLVCQVLSKRMSMLSLQRYGDWTGVQFGQRAVEIAEESQNSPTGSAWLLAEVRSGLAIALWEAGCVDEAITQLRQNLQLGREHDYEPIYINTMLDLGIMVAAVSRRELAEEFLRELDAETKDIPENFPVRRISAGYVKTLLLRRLGRIDEAQRLNEDTLALAQETSSCPDRVLQDIHRAAALLARDIGDSPAVYRHNIAALKLSRRNRRDHPDVRDITMLDEAADAVIEADKLDEADALIAEAERVGRAEFGGDSLVYADVLATRGRLRLLKQEYQNALSDLEYAAAMLRKGSQVNHAGLPSVLVHLAQAAQALGDGRKARHSIQEAYDIDLDRYGPDHPETRKDLAIMKNIELLDLISHKRRTFG
jgi:tetratricopeptide (TPR) repeat protein